MPDVINDLVRLALLDAWDGKCVWCGRPLFFNEMEVEHLIPKSLDDEGNEIKKSEALELHGLDAEYDLNGIENLGPSCRPCNGGKGAKPPPDAPIITLRLQRAREKAPGIRETAARMSGDRRIQRAAAILREGAATGNPKAVDALREAAETLNLAFWDATGRRVARLHTALEQLADVGALVAEADSYFDYLPTAGRTGGPGHDIAEGSVMSYSEVRGTVTTRIDVVPRDAAALERYGPQVTLSPTEGEAGERAAALLNEALREGRSVEITEGLDVTFNRLPPFFASQAGQRMSGGTVQLTPLDEHAPRPPIPEWRAEMRMSSGPDTSRLRVRLRQAEVVPEGWDDALFGQHAGLTVAALFRKAAGRGEIRFNFKHAADGSPVREQLAGMRFLEMVSQGGELVVTDQGKAKRPPLQMTRSPTEVPAEARALLALLNDLSILEQRTGARFVLPDEISAEEVRHIARVAALVRDGERSITWHDANLTVLEPAVEKLREGGVMRIDATASTIILGLEVVLGTLRRDLAAYEVVDVAPLEDHEGTFRVTIKPPDTEAAKITEVLVDQVQARRPPPPPRKAAQQRKKSRGGRKRRKKR